MWWSLVFPAEQSLHIRTQCHTDCNTVQYNVKHMFTLEQSVTLQTVYLYLYLYLYLYKQYRQFALEQSVALQTVPAPRPRECWRRSHLTLYPPLLRLVCCV